MFDAACGLIMLLVMCFAETVTEEVNFNLPDQFAVSQIDYLNSLFILLQVFISLEFIGQGNY